MEAVTVVSPSEWLHARVALLEKEKEFTRAKDALAAERRKLPMTKVTKDYTFDILDPETGKEKTVGLADLFEGKTQLILYHFMFHPDHESGCNSCTFLADHFPHPFYLNSRDTALVAVSRAPPAKLETQRRAMGWDRFRWYSSQNGTFNVDFRVTMDSTQAPIIYNYRTHQEWKDRGMGGMVTEDSEQPGLSVFVKDKQGNIYHSYSGYARALDSLASTFEYLDLTPGGRQPLPGRKDLGFERRDTK